MTADDRGFRVRSLGEVAIRCADLPTMFAFYRDIIGLEHLTGDYSDHIRFFRIAPGYAGHTTVLALFHADEQPDGNLTRSDVAPQSGRTSSLHHLALSLPFDEQDAAMAWFRQKGVVYRVQDFTWIGWRGVFSIR